VASAQDDPSRIGGRLGDHRHRAPVGFEPVFFVRRACYQKNSRARSVRQSSRVRDIKTPTASSRRPATKSAGGSRRDCNEVAACAGEPGTLKLWKAGAVPMRLPFRSVPVTEMGVTLEGAAVTRCHYATGVPKSKLLLARARCTTIHVVAVSRAGPPPSARHLSPFRFGTVGHGFDTAVRDEHEAMGRLITPVKGARKQTRSVLHAPTG
jgi:hypothetical protein